MSNTFDSVLMPAILGRALTVLRESCPLLKLVRKDFEGAAAQVGESVSIPVSVAQTVADITPGATAPALADSVITSKTVTLDSYKGTRFHLTDREARAYEAGQIVQGQLDESVRALANSISANVLAKYKSIYGYAGTAATNPFTTNIDPTADLRGILNNQLCPDAPRYLWVGSDEETAALKLAEFKSYSNRGDAETLKTGKIGYVNGFEVLRDSQRPTHTAGTITTGLIAKAATAQALGDKTIVCTTAASTGACALLAGDIISFAGHSQTYVLTADATQTSANTDVTLAIEPGLTTALAGSEAVSVKATHKVNIGGDPSGFALVMRVLPDSIAGAPTFGTHLAMTDSETGVPLKLSYYPGYHSAQWEVSVLWGAAVVDPRKLARLAG